MSINYELPMFFHYVSGDNGSLSRFGNIYLPYLIATSDQKN